MAEHFVLTCNPVWPTQAYVKLAIVKEAGHVLLFFLFFLSELRLFGSGRSPVLGKMCLNRCENMLNFTI